MIGLLAQSGIPKSIEKGVGDPAKLSDLNKVFENVVSVALAFAGIVLFIMLIVGGFRYITAGGDPKGIEGAKKTLTYAIAGIVLVAVSFLLLNFIASFTGANITDFNIIGQ
jgi:hypothetical protein